MISNDFDILASIWILSCNDENPIMSYESLRYRLDLDDDFDIKALIENRGELFRKTVPENRIEEWKQKMHSGKRVPAWIKAYKGEERRKIIDSLKPEDFFRCQFRTRKDANQAPLEIIDWGLQHIERLRKVEIEEKDRKRRKWTEIWIPLASFIVALIAVLLSGIIGYKNLETQRNLKKYELSFSPKQKNYSALMRNHFAAYQNARSPTPMALRSRIDRLEMNYFYLEPFLTKDLRTTTWERYLKFSAMCYEYEDVERRMANDSLKSHYLNLFLEHKNAFRDELYPALFQSD